MIKHVFIVNVNANAKRTLNKVEEIQDICKSLDVNYEFFVTRSKEETMFIAKQFKDEFCVVYAVGGDGTVNTILNSIMGGQAYLGVVPFGSGNDVFRSLKDEDKTITECNVMKVNDLYCLNIFSVGLDAEICAAAEKAKKLGIPRNQIYEVGMLYTFFKHKNEPMFIDIDGVHFYDPRMSMVTVCNGRYYGNGYEIAPKADITSDNADVYMVAGLSKLTMPGFLKAVKNKDHEKHLTKATGRNVQVLTNEPVVANIDGEIVVDDEFNIDTAAGKINVVKNDRVLSLVRRLGDKS